MHASNGIMFNHESPRRGPTFVTRKVSRAVVRICAGIQDCLRVGNLDARRDWGHAKDYVVAMWKMLRCPQPGDYVVGTGEEHSVRQFVEAAFREKGIDLIWHGTGEDEVGMVASSQSQQVVVRVDPHYFRPSEVNSLRADSSKASQVLDWQASVTFPELVRDMIESDDAELRKELYGSLH
jgi:GDPmannose 4,6-dehydratase